MSSSAPSSTIYLNGAPDPVCATFHPAQRDVARDTAVLICPPFGWEDVASYRSRREWAQRLASAGYPTLRLDYPGSGDSGGRPRDPDRLPAWTDSVRDAAQWLLSTTGAQRVAAVGLGLGGLLAYRAAAAGAPLDDLVLWATPSRGRALVHRIRAFSKLERSQFFEGLPEPPPLPAGELEAGGFLLSAQTVADLAAVDLTTTPLPNPERHRVLLLEQSGIPVDARLRDQLEASGVPFSVATGEGYGEMTSTPQHAQPPLAVIDRVTRWLGEASSPAARHDAPSQGSGADKSARMAVGDLWVTETPITIEQPFGQLNGILTEPADAPEHGLCAVMLNAGAVRRIGANRMWVEVARRWAVRGVPTFRLDLEGVGDSDGDPARYLNDAGFHLPALGTQVRAALDALQHHGVAERFVLVGLCSGSYWALQVAVDDPRVQAALMVNPRVLVWDAALAPSRDFRRLFSGAPSLAKIRREATPRRLRALLLWLLASPGRRLRRLIFRLGQITTDSEIDLLLDRLRISGTQALLLFSENEPLDHELVRSARMLEIQQWPNVEVERIPVRDHTLRPNWAQQKLHAALDRALDRELARTAQSPPTTDHKLRPAESQLSQPGESWDPANLA